MRAALVFGLALTILAAAAGPAAGQVEMGFGAGVLYNKMLGSLKNDDWKIDEDYFSYLLSLKLQLAGFFGVEGLLNYYPGKGDIDYTVTPMATGVINLLGDLVNVGAGINASYVKFDAPGSGSEDKWSDLTYHLKAGVQIPLGPIWLNGDIYYFIDQFKDVEDFDEDYLTFGARVHLRF